MSAIHYQVQCLSQGVWPPRYIKCNNNNNNNNNNSNNNNSNNNDNNNNYNNNNDNHDNNNNNNNDINNNSSKKYDRISASLSGGVWGESTEVATGISTTNSNAFLRVCGVNLQGVRCVIHYQVAASADTYVHRSGRTARAEEEGLAVSLVSPKDSPRFAALLKVGY
jgi:hypothetical protein